MKRSIDRRIEIRRNFRAENALILGDASEMNNAILNLALNARDAIEGRGTMTFATRNGENDTIVFTLSDTGRGIDPEIMEKVFEPFFTTKPIGDGTGMGLSAVYGTVQAHNGTISMDSTPGEGTTVTVTLPLSCSTTETPEGADLSPAGTWRHRSSGRRRGNRENGSLQPARLPGIDGTHRLRRPSGS